MSQYRTNAGPTCAEDVIRHGNQPRKRDETEVVEEAVPRLFQREMLQMALRENVVFHAPTVRWARYDVGLRSGVSITAMLRRRTSSDSRARAPARRTSRRCSSATS